MLYIDKVEKISAQKKFIYYSTMKKNKINIKKLLLL